MKKRLFSLAAFACLLVSLCAVPLTGAAASIMPFGAWESSAWNDGGYYVTGLAVSGSGDSGLTITQEDPSSTVPNRCIWAFENAVIEKTPYLIYETADAISFEKMEVTARFNAEVVPEMIQLETTAGTHCVDLLTLLAGKDTIGYTYVMAYAALGTSVTFQKLYLSDTDLNGNVYAPPTMPPVPDGDEAHAVKYQLKAYAADTVDENGYGWLMSVADDGTPTIVCTPDAQNIGFTLQRAEGRKEEYVNVAWVVPYEQLAKTPYLVLDIANTGRKDEGSKINMFSYWEGAGGNAAYFDNIGHGEVFANTLTGVNKWPLKYAVDQLGETARGDRGIAIILRLYIDRTDGTTSEPLRINQAYLLGYEDGYEEGGNHYTTPGSDEGSNDGHSAFPWLIVGIVVAAAAGAAVAVILLKRKK